MTPKEFRKRNSNTYVNNIDIEIRSSLIHQTSQTNHSTHLELLVDGGKFKYEKHNDDVVTVELI